MDRGDWQATVHGVARVGQDLVTKPPPCCSLRSPHPLFSSLCPRVYTCTSTSASLFLPCRQVHQYHFLRFHMNALLYGICLSDLLHSVQQALSSSTSVQSTQRCSFLRPSNIPLLCIYTIPSCVYIPQSFYLFICRWTLASFHVLAIVNGAAINSVLHVSF